MGQSSDGNEIDSRLCHFRNPWQSHIAACLQFCPVRGDADRLGHIRCGHIVEQNVFRFGFQRFRQFRQRIDFDFHLQVGILFAGAFDGAEATRPE